MVLEIGGLFSQKDVRENVGEADTALNTIHRISSGTDHANVVLSDTHRAGNGSDHTDTALNSTHRTSVGTDHANVATNTSGIATNVTAIALNTTHRGSTGADHSAVVTNTTKVTNATHTGEVTGSATLTIADNIVDEANLKVNAATNGYVLTAQSGESGGIKWEAPAASGVTVPIGAVVSWLKTYTNTPALPGNYVECNGQTLSDGDSVYNGQVIPDLNGDNRFVRGNATSGGTGGSSTHTLLTAEMPAHTHVIIGHTSVGDGYIEGNGGAGETATQNTNSTGGGGAHENKPPYYNIVWIMRIK